MTGQGNKVSRDMHKDKSYLIIKQIENQRLGAIMKLPMHTQVEDCTSLLFAHSIDLFCDSEDAERKMKKIDTHDSLH